MGWISKWFGKKSAAGSPAAPKFVKKERKGGNTYEVYRGKDAESARQFLMTKRVDEPQYYIVVETAEGNWGLDVQGLYLERLLPFQTNLSLADCQGGVCGMPDMFGLQMAARGVNDNFIVKVECGKCQCQWSDGVRYQKTTVVRCPQCKTHNKVETDNFKVMFA